jgi:predicted MFS family arabinose efflux permease
VFSAIAVAGVVLTALTLREPAPAREETGERGVATAVRQRTMQAGLAVIVLVGLFFGVVEVLAPLQLDRLGASAAVIGGAFLVGAGLEGLISRPIGRFTDRLGPLPPVRVALAAGAVLAVALPALDVAWPVAVLVALAGPAVGALWVPGTVMLSDGAEAAGLDQAFAFALMNLSWAGAQAVGAAGGGGLADAAGDWAAFGALGAVMALALAGSLAVTPRRLVGHSADA